MVNVWPSSALLYPVCVCDVLCLWRQFNATCLWRVVCDASFCLWGFLICVGRGMGIFELLLEFSETFWQPQIDKRDVLIVRIWSHSFSWREPQMNSTGRIKTECNKMYQNDVNVLRCRCKTLWPCRKSSLTRKNLHLLLFYAIWAFHSHAWYPPNFAGQFQLLLNGYYASLNV